MKLVFSVCLVFLLVPNLHAVYCGNWVPPVVNTPPPPVNPKAAFSPDVDAASAFLSAHQQALGLLYDLERAEAYGIDFETARKKIQPIVDCLNQAKSTTGNLIEDIDHYGYKQELLYRIICFDYSHMIRQRRMNPVIAEEVRSMLNEGRIRDYLAGFIRNINDIRRQMNVINQSLRYKKIDTGAAHKMSNLFSEALLRGDYISQMLEEALK